nr:hypothetical protein Iba_chr07aCG15940 [Ipomoea batatas]
MQTDLCTLARIPRVVGKAGEEEQTKKSVVSDASPTPTRASQTIKIASLLYSVLSTYSKDFHGRGWAGAPRLQYLGSNGLVVMGLPAF